MNSQCCWPSKSNNFRAIIFGVHSKSATYLLCDLNGENHSISLCLHFSKQKKGDGDENSTYIIKLLWMLNNSIYFNVLKTVPEILEVQYLVC